MDAKSYEGLKKRIEKVKHRRVEINTELQMLKTERDSILDKLKELGIDDVSNLAQQITHWQQELQAQETALLKRLQEIEGRLAI